MYNTHCALFQEFIENIFKFSDDSGVQNKVLWKVASSRAKDLKPVFLYLAKYSVKILLRQGNIL